MLQRETQKLGNFSEQFEILIWKIYYKSGFDELERSVYFSDWTLWLMNFRRLWNDFRFKWLPEWNRQFMNDFSETGFSLELFEIFL